jgi:hypothetical protein
MLHRQDYATLLLGYIEMGAYMRTGCRYRDQLWLPLWPHSYFRVVAIDLLFSCFLELFISPHHNHSDVTPFIGPVLMRVGGCGHAGWGLPAATFGGFAPLPQQPQAVQEDIQLLGVA